VIGLAFLVACSGSDGPAPDTGANENNNTGANTPSTGKETGKSSSTDKNGGTTTPASGTNGPDGKPGTADDKTQPTPPPNQDEDNPGNQPGVPGQNGQAGRVSVNEHCCFNGKYQRCPNANACLGGFDLNACLANCSPFDPCFDECFDKIDNAGPPNGCDANAAPPPGVDCANGEINL